MISLQINEDEEILIIAPHPDDECIGPGGILCKFPKQCTVIAMTDGWIGQGKMSSKESRIIRKNEFIHEMNFLGVKEYKFMNIPDGMLMRNTDCLETVDFSTFSKIFVTSDSDGHADHTAAFLSVANALLKQGNSRAEVYLYEVHKELSNPTHYLDISDCIDKKISAVQFHESQIKAMPYDRYIKVNAECRALQNRKTNSYWEVYTKIVSKQEVNVEKIEMESELQKFKLFYQVLTRWMLNGNDQAFRDYLVNHRIYNCALYGYAELGKIVRRKLEDTDIEIKYIMDKQVHEDPEGELEFYYPQKDLMQTDAVIVTAVYYFVEIKEELRKLGFCNIYSLYDIITNM